jgi:hypothetical protein
MAGPAGLRRAARTALRAAACRRRSAPAGQSNLEVRTLPAPLRDAPRYSSTTVPVWLGRQDYGALRAPPFGPPPVGGVLPLRGSRTLRFEPCRPHFVTLRRYSSTTFPVWLGRQDSNLRMPGSKPGALPLGDGPMNRSIRFPAHRVIMPPAQRRAVAQLHHPAAPGLRLRPLCRTGRSLVGKQPEQAAPGAAEARGSATRLQPAQRGIDGGWARRTRGSNTLRRDSVPRGRDSLGGTVSCQFRGTEHRGGGHRDTRVDQQRPGRVGFDRNEPFPHTLGPGGVAVHEHRHVGAQLQPQFRQPGTPRPSPNR